MSWVERKFMSTKDKRLVFDFTDIYIAYILGKCSYAHLLHHCTCMLIDGFLKKTKNLNHKEIISWKGIK